MKAFGYFVKLVIDCWIDIYTYLYWLRNLTLLFWHGRNVVRSWFHVTINCLSHLQLWKENHNAISVLFSVFALSAPSSWQVTTPFWKGLPLFGIYFCLGEMLFDFKTLHQANLLQPELGGGLLLSGMLNNEIAFFSPLKCWFKSTLIARKV